MVDAAVEAKQHPLRDGRIGQQTTRLADQIVEIQPATSGLARLIGRQKHRGEAMQGQGFLGRHQAKSFGPRRLYAKHQRLQAVQQRTQRGARRLGGESRYLGGKRLFCARSGQQNAFQSGKIAKARRIEGQSPQFRSIADIGRRTGSKAGGDLRKPLLLAAKEYLREDGLRIGCGVHIKQPKRLVARQKRLESSAMA
ncbi:hypothetical protein GALL_453720 [mine drainage metagenome]|uniref:Uncharacterized protein n=1 Tax=mine drainage metagenome TaxID=410659 RepID=A0A1J5Q6A7_9ZZZZ